MKIPVQSSSWYNFVSNSQLRQAIMSNLIIDVPKIRVNLPSSGLQELIEQQDINPYVRPEVTGIELWESDEEFESFLSYLKESRQSDRDRQMKSCQRL